MPTNADARSPPPPETPPLKMLGKYEIQKRLGSGGMGAVFLAIDTALNRTVALKLLPRERAANATLVKRFKSEGQAAARLEHDNIVKVFDSGEIDGYLFLALEFVDGADVQDLVQKRGVIPVRRSIEIIRQVATALQHAADKGIVHRDIKPSNLMIRRDGVVKLADMGLARAVDETIETSITRAGMTVGTVDYMSPEQASDSKLADIRSDLYSLGCTWYHMLTGVPPYPLGSVTQKLNAHAIAIIPDPRNLNDRVPDGVVAVLQRLMAKRPGDRYQTPAELIKDLDQPSLGRQGLAVDALAGLADSGRDLAASDDDPTDPTMDAAPRSPILDAQRGKASPRKGRTRRNARSAAAHDPSAAAPTAEPSPSTRDGIGAKRPQGSRGGSSRDPAAAADRALPEKSKNPAALGEPDRRIDPELIKYGVLGGLGLLVVGCLVWGFMQLTEFGGERSSDGVNPYLSARMAQNRAKGNEPPRVPDDPYSEAPPASHDSPPPPPPLARVTRYREFTPFAGIRPDQDSAGIPSWVFEERALPVENLQTFRVGHSTAAATYGTLRAAIEAMPPTGGIIEFVGRGPFRCDLDIANRAYVILRGANGGQPVLRLEPHADDSTNASLASVGGVVECVGLHFVAPSRLDPNARLISVTAGTLLMRDCTLTAADPATGKVAAIEVIGSPDGAPHTRCILENVAVRGNNLTAVRLRGSNAQVVIGNSLLASGDAAVVEVLASPANRPAAAVEPPALSVVASSLLSRRAAIALHGDSQDDQPTAKIELRNSLLAGSGPSSTTFVIDSWPEDSSANLDSARVAGIDLTTVSTLWLGWAELVEMSNPGQSPISVPASEAGWRQFWRSPVESRAFLAAAAPGASDDHTRLDADALADWLTASLEAAGAGHNDVVIGNPAALPTPPESLIERWLARFARPVLPEGFEESTGPVVTIDLDKDALKLNTILNSATCPDGAHVILRGKGRRTIEPVELIAKSLRLEFQATEGNLTIEPVPRSGSERPEALFRVRGGRLDLIGATVRIPSSDTRPFPLRILQVIDGSFSIQGCSLQGQLRNGALDVPLVEWIRSPEHDSSLTGFGYVVDSFLAAPHQAVGGDVSGRLLQIDNSIIASLSDALSLGALSPSAGDGHVVLTDCTLLAGNAIVNVRPFDGAASPRAKLHVHADNSVFGPPLGDAAASTVVLFPPEAVSTGLLQWWEDHTAHSSTIATTMRVAASDATTGTDAGAADWGPDHLGDVATGPTAVLMQQAVTDLEKATPGDFDLDPHCEAARWSELGGPIGASLDRSRKTDSGGASGQPNNPQRPAPAPGGRTRPNF